MSWFALFLVLLLLGLALLWLARRTHTHTGLPEGQVISADMGAWRRTDRPFFSARHQLAGRPDYVVADGMDLIPVEVKSGRAPIQPYETHVLQLAAYCLLVKETSGRRPPHGILRYADCTFEIDYTRKLEAELLAVLDAMRDDLAAGDAPRDHDDPWRCAACGYRELCPEALLN
ncbi:MAG: CRISPR-associated protein Cas4 [Anaerolineae bacterium]|nr:CRISPR-associated protein Cas4 [Anaerolineae bacterium]